MGRSGLHPFLYTPCYSEHEIHQEVTGPADPLNVIFAAKLQHSEVQLLRSKCIQQANPKKKVVKASLSVLALFIG